MPPNLQLAIDTGKVIFVNSFLLIWATGLTKISVLLFYRRLGDYNFSKYIKWLIMGANIFTVLYIIGSSLMLFLTCIPTSANWESDNFGDQQAVDDCNHEEVFCLLITIWSMVGDVYVLGIPMFVFAKMNLPWKRKLKISIVFGCGFLWVPSFLARIWTIADHVQQSFVCRRASRMALPQNG